MLLLLHFYQRVFDPFFFFVRWLTQIMECLLKFTFLFLELFQEFDSTYGPAWHCIVGTSFGSYVTHSIGGFLYFSIDKVYVLLFRTAVEPLDNWQYSSWFMKNQFMRGFNLICMLDYTITKCVCHARIEIVLNVFIYYFKLILCSIDKRCDLAVKLE